jgi:2-polyprenyl-3-methyl-5-hydroxy-6-metoxy-1,4-benzoquinol methylase
MPWWDHVLAGPAAGRSTEQELLDAEELDPHELRTNLREMAMLNRLPGGIDASLAGIRWAVRGFEQPRVLDVGTGWGDLPRRLVRELPAAEVLALDSHPQVLAIARRNLRRSSRVTLRQADARALPLEAGSFEVAHASLLAHHLEPDGVVEALAEMRRVATRGVVLNDLQRGRLAVAVNTITVLALSRGRYTRNDGPISSRRAYTLPELDRLAARAGLAPAWRTHSAWPRVTTVYR